MNTRRQRATFTAGLAVALAAVLALAGSHAIRAQDAYPSTDNLPTCPHVCPTKTINLDDSARQPFVFSYKNTFDDGELGGGASQLLAVPDGKRLVIEYVNGWAESPGIIEATLTTTLGGKDKEWNLRFQSQGLDPADHTRMRYAIDSPVKIYADPGSTFKLFFSRPKGLNGTIDVKANVSGYFVDL